MNKRNFLKELNIFGFVVNEIKYHRTTDSKLIHNLCIRTPEKKLVATVRDNEQYRFIVHNELLDIEKEYREDFYDLLVDYARTDVEERHKVEKYYIRLLGVRKYDSYLNKLPHENEYLFSSLDNDDFKTLYTEDDLHELPEWIHKGLFINGTMVMENVND